MEFITKKLDYSKEPNKNQNSDSDDYDLNDEIYGMYRKIINIFCKDS